MTKYPPHLFTIVIDFGPAIPSFQQHFADETKALRTMQYLKDKALKAKGVCIEAIRLWHNNALISSFVPNPPPPVWLPPPDENGVRHIPEYGKRSKAKKPHRLPSTAVSQASGTPFKLTL